MCRDADANKQRSIPGSEWPKPPDPETASRTMKEYLAILDDAANMTRKTSLRTRRSHRIDFGSPGF